MNIRCSRKIALACMFWRWDYSFSTKRCDIKDRCDEDERNVVHGECIQIVDGWLVNSQGDKVSFICQVVGILQTCWNTSVFL
jgi:hypothetical protein